MRIQSLQLNHFRNYAQQSIEFGDGINVFIGDNAQGKTNALEAISVLALGKSHRTQKDAEFIQWGEESAGVSAEVLVQNHTQKLGMRFLKTGKKAQVNGIHVTKMTDFIGRFQVVLFAPEDLLLVKGSPGLRRRFLDMELGQTKPTYLHHLSQYGRTLQQRNTLLKQHPEEVSLLEVLDEQLVRHAVPVLLERFRFVYEMKQLAQGVYRAIAKKEEELDVHYASSIPGIRVESAEELGKVYMDSLHQQGAREALTLQVAKKVQQALEMKRKSDVHMGSTSVGPHRDDLLFYLDGQSVQSFASQGQQRTIALALRLAEIDFIKQEMGEYPVLLLDDVLSELDDRRQTNLLLSMSQKVQTVLTTTSLTHLVDRLGPGTRLFYVRSGIIQKEG